MFKSDRFLAYVILFILLLSACVPPDYNAPVLSSPLPKEVNMRTYNDVMNDNVCYYTVVTQGDDILSVSPPFCVSEDME